MGLIGHVKGDFAGFDHKQSTFSKMRRKRPPPINISVENGNVILTSATPTSRVVYADSQWPSTPQTPHTAGSLGCANPRCVERDSGLLSLLHPQFSGSTPWLQPASASNPSTPSQQCFPVAELPGSLYAPQTVELDVPAALRRPSFDHISNNLEPLPSLVSSSAPSTGPDQVRDFAFERGQLGGPMHNGRAISDMDFEELMEALPDLSSRQIKLYWSQAMRREALKLKHGQLARPSLETEAGPSSPEKETKLAVNDDLERLKLEYEIQLDSQKNEICRLLEVHDSRMSALCDFISERHGTEASGNDPSLQMVQTLVKEQKQRVLTTTQEGKPLAADCLQNKKLQADVAELESRVARQNRRFKTYQTEFRLLKQEINDYIEADSRQRQEISEKGAQISILNNKVTQLLTMGPCLFPSSSMSYQTEKKLPSPGPNNGNGAGQSKHRTAHFSRTRSAKTSDSPSGSKESLNSGIISAASHARSKHHGKQRRSTVV